MKLIEHSTQEEMLENLEIIQVLHPNLTYEKYKELLEKMIPHNYAQLIAVTEEGEKMGITGFWIGHKIWSGKYLELDNVVVREDYRSRGVGELMTQYLIKKAQELACDMLGLDVYTYNFKGVKFYMNQGFDPTGFHMIKKLK
jgi:GNAT superfamily N-acetyltransferase